MKKMLVIFASATFAAISIHAQAPDPAPSGLVAWWPAEGNANDIVGTNNGVLFNGATYAAGMVGQGFSFGGANSYVQIANSPSLNQTNEFTIELWYKDTGSAMGFGLVSKRPPTVGACNFDIQVTPGNPGTVSISFEESTSGTFQISTYSPAPAAGIFHHVAATFKQMPASQVEVKTFIDGQLVKTAALSGRLANTVNNVPVTMGCDSASGGDFIKGVIDEVSYYDRALSSNEVAAIYNAGSAGKSIASSVPIITGVSPASGTVGGIVSITGTNFSPVTANNTVYFGAVRAVVNAASSTNLMVSVPAGATYAPITETVNGLTAWANTPFLPTFLSAGLLTNASLGPQFTLQTGSSPGTMVIADLDGDDKPDLAVNNGGDHTIYIYRNVSTNGVLTTNSFAPPVILPLGTGGEEKMIAGDVDGDGKSDLLCLDQSSNVVVVLKNLSTAGIIAFGPRVNFAVGAGRRGVAVRDLDGDGKPEIVVGNYGDSTISILRNIGTVGSITTNSFSPAVNLAGGTGTEQVAITDLDGDGKPDVVTSDYNSGNNISVSVFRNVSVPGNIAFAARMDLPGPTYSLGLAIGDMDGDGRQDVVFVSFAVGQSVSVYRNTSTPGGITFAPSIDSGLGGWGNSVALGDVDGDGKPDVAAVSQNGTKLSLFRNISVPGSFTNSSLAARLDFPSGSNPYGVAIGDLDGDGRPDVVFANNFGDTISIYQNIVPFGGQPAIAPPIITGVSPASGNVSEVVSITGTNFSPVTASNTVYFGAVQAVVSAASATNLVVSVPVGATYAPITETVNGLTAYSPLSFLPTFPSRGILTDSSLAARLDLATPSSPDLVAIGDLDGDGKPDLVVHCGVNIISIFQNISTNGAINAGSFGPRINLPIGGSSSTAGGLALADLSGDGRLDIVTSSYVDGKVSVFQNFCIPGLIKNNSFGTRVDIPVNGGPITLAVQDLDGDGWLDIVTGNVYVNTVSVLRNLGAGGNVTTNSFAAQVNFAVVLNSRWVTIADLDGDGRPDVATVNYNDGSGVMSVFRNTSTPGSISSNSFAPRLDFTGLPDGSDVKTCDLVGDGKLDVVVAAGANGRAVSVYRNTSTPGNVAFASRVDFGLGGLGNGVALGDLDGDGKPDVAAAARSGDNLSLFRNVSVPGSFTSSSLAARLDFSSGSNPYGPAIGDLDGDGRPDVVFANNFSGTISIYQNIVHPPIHFVWNPIPSPRFVNTPFTVVVQAQDPTNKVATNFTGTVTLQSTNGLPVSPAVSGSFIQGVWIGTLTVPQTAANLVLEATDDLGESGQANPINVLNLPTLTALSSRGILLIVWPVSPSGFVVETSPGLSPANWLPVTNQQPFQYGGQNLLPIPMSGTNAFYRLHFIGP